MARGDNMDSNNDDQRRKTRSERHEEKEKDNNTSKPKTRSERHQLKKEKQNRKKHLSPRSYIERKTVVDCSSHQDEITTEDEVEETNASANVQHQKDIEEEDSSAEKEKKRKGFVPKLKHFIISFGVIFVLALIAYTIILYGGKLFVD